MAKPRHRRGPGSRRVAPQAYGPGLSVMIPFASSLGHVFHIPPPHGIPQTRHWRSQRRSPLPAFGFRLSGIFKTWLFGKRSVGNPTGYPSRRASGCRLCVNTWPPLCGAVHTLVVWTEVFSTIWGGAATGNQQEKTTGNTGGSSAYLLNLYQH